MLNSSKILSVAGYEILLGGLRSVRQRLYSDSRKIVILGRCIWCVHLGFPSTQHDGSCWVTWSHGLRCIAWVVWVRLWPKKNHIVELLLSSASRGSHGAQPQDGGRAARHELTTRSRQGVGLVVRSGVCESSHKGRHPTGPIGLDSPWAHLWGHRGICVGPVESPARRSQPLGFGVSALVWTCVWTRAAFDFRVFRPP